MSDDISQEDENLKRAIAESLGQIYTPPSMQLHLQSRSKESTSHSEPKIELFQPQKLITYEEAIDMILNINCCFEIYDKKINEWRTAIFMKKWDTNKRLMIRFPQEQKLLTANPNNGSDKFLTIKDFPVNYIILNHSQIFNITKRELRD
eukprot:6583_1